MQEHKSSSSEASIQPNKSLMQENKSSKNEAPVHDPIVASLIPIKQKLNSETCLSMAYNSCLNERSRIINHDDFKAFVDSKGKSLYTGTEFASFLKYKHKKLPQLQKVGGKGNSIEKKLKRSNIGDKYLLEIHFKPDKTKWHAVAFLRLSEEKFQVMDPADGVVNEYRLNEIDNLKDNVFPEFVQFKTVWKLKPPSKQKRSLPEENPEQLRQKKPRITS